MHNLLRSETVSAAFSRWAPIQTELAVKGQCTADSSGLDDRHSLWYNKRSENRLLSRLLIWVLLLVLATTACCNSVLALDLTGTYTFDIDNQLQRTSQSGSYAPSIQTIVFLDATLARNVSTTENIDLQTYTLTTTSGRSGSSQYWIWTGYTLRKIRLCSNITTIGVLRLNGKYGFIPPVMTASVWNGGMFQTQNPGYAVLSSYTAYPLFTSDIALSGSNIDITAPSEIVPFSGSYTTYSGRNYNVAPLEDYQGRLTYPFSCNTLEIKVTNTLDCNASFRFANSSIYQPSGINQPSPVIYPEEAANRSNQFNLSVGNLMRIKDKFDIPYGTLTADIGTDSYSGGLEI